MIFKKRLPESEAGALLAELAFRQGKAIGNQLYEWLEHLVMRGKDVIPILGDRQGFEVLAVLASTFNAARHHSPVFAGKRATAHRLEFWTLQSVLSDHADEFVTEPASILAAFRRYQRFDLEATNRQELPYGAVAGALLCDFFSDDLALISDAEGAVNHLVLTFTADLLMAGSTDLFVLLRNLTEQFKLTESPLPPM